MTNFDENLTPWAFVERFYPDYSSCDDIALADDLEKLINEENEEGDCSDNLLKRDYNGDLKNPQISTDYYKLHNDIFQEAAKNFLVQEKEANKPEKLDLADFFATETAAELDGRIENLKTVLAVMDIDIDLYRSLSATINDLVELREKCYGSAKKVTIEYTVKFCLEVPENEAQENLERGADLYLHDLGTDPSSPNKEDCGGDVTARIIKKS